MYIEKVNSPADVKKLSVSEMNGLGGEIRQVLLNKLSSHGGHVGPNLGMVEATIALHYVFDSPTDKIVYDVSHQSYTHKILTGRRAAFMNADEYDEVSGYSEPSESEHDFFVIGHTSTSVSLASGLAKARDLKGETGNVIAVIGDGSLSGGEAFEGLNVGAELGTNFIVIVNDNQMSIAENHGGLYRNLQQLRETEGQAPCNYFKAMGYDYLYVKDGNDVEQLIEAFREVKDKKHPVVVHINTLKGKGYKLAEEQKERFHYSVPFDLETGNLTGESGEGEDYADLTAGYLLQEMKKDPTVVGITAGTPTVFGFTPERRKEAGRQFIDMGIAEEQAVAMASAIAAGGGKPVFGVYSTFIQRAYDQLLHDVALSGLHVVFAVDRAGLVGADGATHHGVMDTVFLSGIPNMTVLCPASFAELRAMLRRALFEMTGPVAIRYPRGGEGAFTADTSAGDFAELRTGKDITLCAYGTLINNVLGAAELLHEDGIEARVVKLNRISPFRGGELSRIFGTTKRLLVAEECSGVGCIGQRIAAILAEEGHEPQRLMLCNLGRRFIEQGSVGELYRQCGLDAESLARTAKEVCQ